ncbi:MAG: NAD(P)H-dependent flavin oxidoreductase [Sphingobacteriaceae bacterium]
MNSLQKLFGIKYPIVQAGMVWCSGWRLASAVSNAGGLGLIGAGSMYPDVLREHLQKCKKATNKPFGVNIPLLYPNMEEMVEVILQEGVKIVFSSAGNPATWTPLFKENGLTVAHVVSNVKFAQKAADCGVDAVVAEGFEAGGHNGREETTTLCLVPMVREAIDLPLLAAGGIASGKSMLAAMALGADGVQVGSRFAVAKESSAHENFKQAVLAAHEGDTKLRLKSLVPVRLLQNDFARQVAEAEAKGASPEELAALLGRARAKKGMFEGDLSQGELEIGQVSAMLDRVELAEVILQDIWQEFLAEKNRLTNLDLS